MLVLTTALIAGGRISYSSAGGRTTCSGTSSNDCLVTSHIANQVCLVFSKAPQSLSLSHFLVPDRVRIPTKPAMHSNVKPATCSDPKPAGVPI